VLATAHTVFIPGVFLTINVHVILYSKPLMQSPTLRQQTAHCDCDVSEDDDSDHPPHSLVSGLTSQSNNMSENLPANGTSATAADAAANGTTPSQHGAKSDTDNDDDISLGSSDVEDPEITAMKEEMIRYVNRGPPRQPQASHGHAVPQKPRPAPQPVAGAPKGRPPAITLGAGTTAKPKPKK